MFCMKPDTKIQMHNDHNKKQRGQKTRREDPGAMIAYNISYLFVLYYMQGI